MIRTGLMAGALLALSLSTASAQEDAEAEHPRDLGRRHRHLEHQPQQPRHDGLQTPNIDRIANEGVAFTDYYGQQSCTAGRAAFIGGNVPVRTGMTKVGLPGANEGWQPDRRRPWPTMLKSLGYATGAVRQEPPGRSRRAPADNARLRRVLRQPLPPERRGGAGEPPTIRRDGLADGRFRERFGPRGVLHTWAQAGRYAEDRGHRPADQEAHGDDRRRDRRRRQGVHRASEPRRRQALLRVVERAPACTSAPT